MADIGKRVRYYDSPYGSYTVMAYGHSKYEIVFEDDKEQRVVATSSNKRAIIKKAREFAEMDADHAKVAELVKEHDKEVAELNKEIVHLKKQLIRISNYAQRITNAVL